MNPFLQNAQDPTQRPLSALELFDFATPTVSEGLDLESLPGFRQRDKALNDLSQTRDSIGGQRQVTNDLLLGDPSMIQPDIFQPEQGDNGQLFSPVRRSRNGVTQSRGSEEFRLGGGSGGGGGGSITAQVTRYGFSGDKYQNHTATGKGSSHENIGNRNNRLERGVSVALPPKTAKALGINPKAGEFVEANINGKWQRFRVDDTAGKHKNNRIDFYDPDGNRKAIDGSQIQIRKAGGKASSGSQGGISASNFRKKYNSIVTRGTSAAREGGLEFIHPEMRSNFDSLMSSAPKEIRNYLRINSAYRDVEKQQSIEGGRKRATVASPGKSMHQYGLAIDLGNPSGGLLKASNSSKEKRIVDWLQSNAPKYGLNMRLSYHKGKGLIEDWQIEHAEAFDIAPNRSVQNARKYRSLISQQS